MYIKRNINFFVERRKKAGVLVVENVPIRMRILYNGWRIEFTTGFRIDATKWDSEKQRVKNGCTNKLKQSSSQINASLQEEASIIQQIFQEYEVKGIMPTQEQIKEEFNKRMSTEEPLKPEEEAAPEEPQISFFDVYDLFLKDGQSVNGWANATYRKMKVVRGHLQEFNDQLTFDFFDEEGLNQYLAFLRDEKDMINTTLNRQIGLLKWFLRWAKKRGYCQKFDYELYKPKLKTANKEIIFLEWDELTKLRECEIPESKQYLERVRDVFLFLCFTGIRHSDAYNLRRSDIRDDYFVITTIKTSDRLKIELNNHSRAILDKYADVHFEKDKALPVISNQKMNKFLKELCKLAGIDQIINEVYYQGGKRMTLSTPKYELIGTHAGRRTFICNALALGIPEEVVRKWTGHSSYQAMKPYIAIADSIKADAMSKFNQL